MIWVGTNGGLNRYNTETDNFVHYFVQHGLPSNYITGVVVDETNGLWISSKKGISFYNQSDSTFTNYGLIDGIGNIDFHRHSYDYGNDGNIFFGGKTRYESVKNALFKLKINKDDIVSIHDGVRPFISTKLINKLFKSAIKKGHAAPILAPKDSLRMFIKNSSRTKSVNRSSFRFTQTPQIFKGNIIEINKLNNSN